MLDEKSLDWLVRQLQSEDAFARSHAASWLGIFRDVRTIAALIAVLCDADEQVRESAVLALGAMCDPAVVEPLKAALRDESSAVRQLAVEALHHFDKTFYMGSLPNQKSHPQWLAS